MNFQDKLSEIWQKIESFPLWKKTKSLIDKGIIQRIFRISYDVLWNIVLYFLVIGLLGFFLIGGIGAGYFAYLIKDEPLRSSESMVNAIYNYEETSEVYFADNIYMGKVSSDLHREETTLDRVSQDIINGVIATEDEYFETHNGIVPKAIMRAMYQEVTGSNVQTGGSTLTQQIIKNQILTNEVSFDRKAKEIILAMRLENFMEKDEILEAYLNIVPFGRNANGRNIAGIQTAASGIFGVNADEVNLAQAAFLAGLPQSPSAYTPFTNRGVVKSEEGLASGLSRMETVLSRMLSAGYITQSEYDEAMEFDIIGSLTERLPTTYDQYPYLSEEVRRRTETILKEKLALEDGYTLEELESNSNLNEQYQIYARRELSQGGYKIHTTVDKELYDTFQEVTANYNNFGRDKTARTENGDVILTKDPDTGEMVPLVQQQQVGAVLIENKTGAILAFVPGRDFERDNVNFATGTARRQIGSTAKPILVYAPSFEEGLLQPGSIIPDVEFEYDDGISTPWRPKNFTENRYYGLVTARSAVVNSYNVSTAHAYINLLKEHDPVPDYLVKMGFDHFPENRYSLPSNALGSFEATVEENTNAFATFSNGGQFVDSYMIEKIETVEGEVIYQHEIKPVDVFSRETSYLMFDILRDVFSEGTARTARNNIKNKNVDWGAKTGTTDYLVDHWVIGTNPNVTLGSWSGYGYRQTLDSGYSGRNQILWAQLVNAATELRPELMAPEERFEQPEAIVTRPFSLVSGLKPTELTQSLGLVGEDLFHLNYIPEVDDYSLVEGSHVSVDGDVVVPGSRTPGEFTQGDGIMFSPNWLKDMGYDEFEKINQLKPNNNSPWNRISFPDIGASDIEDNGEEPNPPRSVSTRRDVLRWNRPTSRNTIGYRVYRASDLDEDFTLIESTTEEQLSVGTEPAVYHVTTVDYFGRESEPSQPVIIESNGDSDRDNDDDNVDNTGENDNNNNSNNANENSTGNRGDNRGRNRRNNRDN